jgi:hypothetical protein
MLFALPRLPAAGRWLGDAAMILRDPPALHLLAAELVEVLYRCVVLLVAGLDDEWGW